MPAPAVTPDATRLMFDTIAKSLSFLFRKVGGEENGGRKKYMYISTLLFPDLVMSGFFQEPQTFPSLGMPRSSADRKWLGIMRENFDPQASKFTRAPYSSWASGAELWSGSLKFWLANSPKGPRGIC